MPANEPNRNWKFMLAESDDMTPIGWLKYARDKKLDLALNKPGALSFRMNVTDVMAAEIHGYDVKRCVIAYCDDADGVPTARWSGPIWTSNISLPGETLTVNCVGWYELLNKRELRTEAQFDGLDAGEITRRIIRDANSTTYLVNLLENWSFEGGSFGFTNTNYTTVNRYSAWSTIGSHSLQLFAPNGMTSTLDSGEVDVSGSTAYTAALDVNIMSIGSGTVRLDILWYDVSHVFISTSSSSTASASGETRLSVSDTSPSGAVYAVFRIRTNVTSAGIEVLVDNAILVAGSSTGITEMPIDIGDVTASQSREVTFQQSTKHGAAIDQLVNIEAGFDWYMDPLTRELSVLYDNVKGTIYGRGTDQTDVEFHYGWGAKNVSGVELPVDGSILANRINAKGKYDTGVAYDAASIATYGLFEQSSALSDVVDAETLVAYAGAEVAYKLQPFATYSFQPFPYDGTERVPLFFDEYDIGDIVYLTVKYGCVDVQRQAVRVFGTSIDIDMEGNEKIGTIQTAAS